MLPEGSKKEEFKSREMTFISEVYPRLKVTRSRTTGPHRGITLSVCGDDTLERTTTISFTNETNYVEEVRELARLLIEAADEPCLID